MRNTSKSEKHAKSGRAGKAAERRNNSDAVVEVDEVDETDVVDVVDVVAVLDVESKCTESVVSNKAGMISKSGKTSKNGKKQAPKMIICSMVRQLCSKRSYSGMSVRTSLRQALHKLRLPKRRHT